MRRWTSRLFLVAMLFGCNRSPAPAPKPAASATPPKVIVTNQPLFEMAEAIGCNMLDVDKIVPDGTSSLDWQPGKDDVRAMQQARLILINGAGYEPWKDRVSLSCQTSPQRSSKHADSRSRPRCKHVPSYRS